MASNKLPPLKLNTSETSIRSTESSNQEGSVNQSARERRRIKKASEENSINQTVIPRSNRRARSLPKQQTDDDGNSNPSFIDDDSKNRDDSLLKNKPPRTKRRTRKSQEQNDKIASNNILEGLEEDIIEMDNYESKNVDEDYNTAKDNSQKELINNNEENQFIKSVPTDKFYLELEKKFEIQKKELYEKREQERLRAQFDWQLKQKQKESQKYQISTPKYALKTHKFLRAVFLFFHGINVGFQFWQIIVIFLSNYNSFTQVNILTNGLDITAMSKTLVFFQNLTMPVHCLSYFFLTICIVDSIDRYIYL